MSVTSIQEKEYWQVLGENETFESYDLFCQKLKNIKVALNFCSELEKMNVLYQYCIRHREVLGCAESRRYYQRYKEYIGQEYSICKHLLLQEKKGQRLFLVIVDASKQVDLKEMREILNSKKLEFVSEEIMKESLHTSPGNVSVFHLQYDTSHRIECVMDHELCDQPLLAFHPLYNGMSLFLTPTNVFQYLKKINRTIRILDVPMKQDEAVLVKKQS